MPSVETPSKAGIITAPTGERHIPASVRADGSKRKEIRIRPGYKPPEDVELYKNRTATDWKNRASGGIPGAAGLKDDQETADGNAASNKNAKRREARKKAKADESRDSKGEQIEGSWRKEEPKEQSKEAAKEESKEMLDPEAEKEKKARNLKKKLKQARELQDKKNGGAPLLPEQFAKVIKINELIRELDQLGFDSYGERKSDQ